MAASSRSAYARRLFAPLGPTYDRVGAALSLGQDPRWRRFLVSRVPPGSRVLDVATGTGLVARALAARGCDVTGLDQSPQMLAVARARAGGRVHFVEGEADALPFPDASFDALTFTYLLRYVEEPAATLAELVRVVRPGGVVAMLEFGVPPRPWLAPWRAYTRLALPAVGRLLSPGWHEVGRFLGPSIEELHARVDPVALFEAAGVRDVRRRDLSFGAGVVVWGTRA